MALGDFLARLGGRDEAAPEPAAARSGPPTADELRAALDRTESLVIGGAAPSVVTARVERITGTVRDTIPRLASLGAGSDRAYSVVATATDYLPEAVGGYLRLPRRFADTRPVDGAKTSLMVLVDQLDLLGATMDRIFDAVCRDDARALVVHGRFIEEKFGAPSTGGDLSLGDPDAPEREAGGDAAPQGQAAEPLLRPENATEGRTGQGGSPLLHPEKAAADEAGEAEGPLLHAEKSPGARPGEDDGTPPQPGSEPAPAAASEAHLLQAEKSAAPPPAPDEDPLLHVEKGEDAPSSPAPARSKLDLDAEPARLAPPEAGR